MLARERNVACYRCVRGSPLLEDYPICPEIPVALTRKRTCSRKYKREGRATVKHHLSVSRVTAGRGTKRASRGSCDDGTAHDPRTPFSSSHRLVGQGKCYGSVPGVFTAYHRDHLLGRYIVRFRSRASSPLLRQVTLSVNAGKSQSRKQLLYRGTHHQSIPAFYKARTSIPSRVVARRRARRRGVGKKQIQYCVEIVPYIICIIDPNRSGQELRQRGQDYSYFQPTSNRTITSGALTLSRPSLGHPRSRACKQQPTGAQASSGR